MDYCDEEELVEVVEPAEEQLDDLHMSKCSKKMRLEPVSELSRESKQISSQSSRIDSLCDFAHTLMHCVLYKINYYNKKTHFDKVLKYNIIVYKCKSEVVCEYIANCIESMRLVLYKVHSPGRHSLNRSIFSIGLAVLKAMSDDQPTNDVNLLIKRYTLQIEMKLDGNDEQQSQMDEWNYRDSILKCLYANDIVYPKNFKWQIQMRTSLKAVNELSNDEDLFKLFAWRQCDREEISSISTKPKASYNRISIKPVKTLSHCSMRAQLFIEQPTAPLKSPIHTDGVCIHLLKASTNSDTTIAK